MKKVLIELVEDFDLSYYANVTVEGKPICVELPEYVPYKVLKKAIQQEVGVRIQKKPEFDRFGRKRYAHLEYTI